jgi:cytochrome c-type biogenesis protein CcsB
MTPRQIVLLSMIVLLGAAGAAAAGDAARLDWGAWQRLPVLDDGRIMPLDTFARLQVKGICGSENPRFAVRPEGSPMPAPPDGHETASGHGTRRYGAAELLFSWLAEPEAWERVPFLQAADADVRKEILELPLTDENGRKLTQVSPRQVLDAPHFWERCEQLARWQRDGKERGASEMRGLDKRVLDLLDVYMRYRRLTYNPEAQRRRFLNELSAIADAWREVESRLVRLPVKAGQVNPAETAQQVATLVRKVSAAGQGGAEQALNDARSSLEMLEQLTASLADQLGEVPQMFHQSTDIPAGDMRQLREVVMELTGKTADISRQMRKARIVLHYDGGESLWLVPALDAGPLEADRYRTNGQPWLSLQALMYAPEEELRDYPASEVQAVRQAYSKALTAYRQRYDPEQAGQFDDALKQLSESLAGLGKAVEPLRRRLPIKEKDQGLLAATAYPSAGSTNAEVFYNQLDPFFWSGVACLAAAVALGASFVPGIRKPMFWAGMAMLALAQGIVLGGLWLRGYITGWVPLTGMFETILVVAVCVALLSMVLTLFPPRDRYARRPVAIVGALLTLVALVLANYVPTFHKEIELPRAVLRSNVWLMVHVTTIVASYGAAAMAWMLGNIALCGYLFGRYRPAAASQAAKGDSSAPVVRLRPSAPELCKMLGELNYRVIQVAVLLLAVGTILGGMWADVSWGRFWGWDSKEVWALVSLLAYMLILHARHIGWSGHFTLNLGSVLGFIVVLFTWYGVNFILASGKHAYGGGSGGTWAISVFAAVNLLLLAAAATRYVIATTPAPAG